MKINERLVRVLDACANQSTSFPFVSLVNGSWPWHDLLKRAAYRANKKGIPCELDDDWARQRYTGLCELSGVPFVTTPNNRTMFSLSLDQIKHGKGYTKDNSRFILWGLNAMRGANGSDDDMRKICRAMLRE